MKKKRQTATDAHQKLIETADRLFHQFGILNVSVQRIIKDTGVAVNTFYNHFDSKDELILQVLEIREQRQLRLFQNAIKNSAGWGITPLEGFLMVLKQWFESSDFTGCLFSRTAMDCQNHNETIAEFSRQHKIQFYELIAEAIAKTAGKDALELVPSVILIVEGAITMSAVQKSPMTADLAKNAVYYLLDEYLPELEDEEDFEENVAIDINEDLE